MFVITLIPTLGMVGAAVDYSRATTARQVLNSAVDSAALMAARDAAKLTDAQLRTRINDWIRANLHGEEANSFGNATVTIDRTARTVNIAANLNVQTSLIRLVGQDTVAISSSSQSSWGTNTIELALVLDNTGSMSSSGKMTALKQASLDLIQIMRDAATEPDQIRISIVPFATQVRLDAATYKDEPWMRFDLKRCVGKNCKTEETMDKAKWTASGEGCVADRDKNYDVTDGEAVIDTNPKRFPAEWCANSSLATVLPLTSDWTALTNKIATMTPVGYTNVTIGAVWGMATLSPALPLGQARPAGTPRLTKNMIVLTDGNNTENRFDDSQSTMDSRTRLACESAKSAGVRVYTVRVIDGDRDLLRACATDPSMYYEVSNAAQLSPVFQQIAREISQIRLTQ
jgi:Flp pilus assembly protein TadG